MTHAVTTLSEPFLAMNGEIEVHLVPVWRDNLVWVVRFLGTDDVAVIDGPQADEVLAWSTQRRRRITAILNTHTHPDHIGINRDLDERGLLSVMRVIGPAKRQDDIPGITELVDDGDVIEVGGVQGRVMLTEGHIDGHVSYLFGDVLFCGDTLFGAGCGYLFDGPPAAMHGSLERLLALPEDTKICCAHEYTEDNLRFAWSIDPDNPALAERIRRVWALRAEGQCSIPSTIAEERATNPFVRCHTPEVAACLARAWPGRDLSDPVEVFAATRALKDRKDYKRIPDEALPLLSTARS